MANNLSIGIEFDVKKLSTAGAKKVADALEVVKQAAEETGAVLSKMDYGQRQLDKYNKQLDAITKKRDALQAELAGSATTFVPDLGNLPQQTEQTTRQFNQLGFSIQQVARELPAFTYSASTGFMAISNNLPILADAISNVRKENAVLVAAGKTAVPVWRQVAGSLLSWQTALVVGITALTMYSPQIISFVRNLFSLSDATNQSRKAMEALKNTTESYNTDLLQETNQLRYIYDAILQTSEGTAARRAAIQTLNETYKEYMPYLLSEYSSLDELNTMYNILNSSLRNHIALKVRSTQLDKITEESAKAQSEAIGQLQEALSKQGVSTSLSDDIITTLVNDAPKWKEAGTTLRDAFLQAVRNIQTDSGITVSRDAERGIYDYIQSFYEMDTAVNAVNKRVDLLLGKNNQIKELGTLVVTPETDKGGNKELNKNLTTIGGLTNKINELKEAQSKASAEQAINLEKEIRLYQERLNLLQRTIAVGAAGNLADSNYKDKLTVPAMSGVSAPAEIAIPITFEISENQIRENLQRMRQMFSDSIKEMTIFSGEQITGLVTQSFASLGEAIGSGNALEALKSSLMMVMDMLQQFGSALIAAGVASEALKAVAWSGIGAIIAGGALVAATAAAKAALQNATAFANGGIVSGPTLALVGEYGGARNNPEVIAPLDKLRSLIQPAGFNTDGLYLETKVRGKDLYVALQSVEHERRRVR